MTTMPSYSPNDAVGSMQNPAPNPPPDLLSGASDEEAGKTPYYAMENAVPPVRESFDDFEDDMQSVMAESIVESVMTADGIHDWAGFNVVCLVILIGDMSRGVMFPSMWPLVANLGGSTVTLGYSVAAFSFGRILVSPLFGSWSIQYGYSKTLMFSCSILLLGTLMYAQAQNVGRTEFLILAQTMLGIGSGTLGVTRAFVAEISATRNRTTYMAWVTAVQYAGFTVTPFFGALFNKLFGDYEYQYGYVTFASCLALRLDGMKNSMDYLVDFCVRCIPHRYFPSCLATLNIL
jgi:ceroid-lipofuscinosis MFS transporter 7